MTGATAEDEAVTRRPSGRCMGPTSEAGLPALWVSLYGAPAEDDYLAYLRRGPHNRRSSEP